MRTRARFTQSIARRFDATLSGKMTSVSCKFADIPVNLHNHAALWRVVGTVEQLQLVQAPLSPDGNSQALSPHDRSTGEFLQALEGSTR